MRPINADRLKEAIVEEGQRSKRYKIGEFWELNREEIWKVIDEMPTLQVKRRRAYWEGVMRDDGTPPQDTECWCSYCHNYRPLMPNDEPARFCPHCGACMVI